MRVLLVAINGPLRPSRISLEIQEPGPGERCGSARSPQAWPTCRDRGWTRSPTPPRWSRSLSPSAGGGGSWLMLVRAHRGRARAAPGAGPRLGPCDGPRGEGPRPFKIDSHPGDLRFRARRCRVGRASVRRERSCLIGPRRRLAWAGPRSPSCTRSAAGSSRQVWVRRRRERCGHGSVIRR